MLSEANRCRLPEHMLSFTSESQSKMLAKFFNYSKNSNKFDINLAPWRKYNRTSQIQ